MNDADAGEPQKDTLRDFGEELKKDREAKEKATEAAFNEAFEEVGFPPRPPTAEDRQFIKRCLERTEQSLKSQKSEALSIRDKRSGSNRAN